jgi:hypothetical protein
MHLDPIVEEIREIRKAHSAKYGNDLDRIVEALREKERLSTRPVLNPGPRRIPVTHASESQETYGE